MNRTITFLLVVAGFALPAVALATPADLKLDRQDISSKQCKPDASSAKQLVNVHFTLINDWDSGVGVPQGWANDTITRQLRIWQLSGGNFCAQVSDHGKFVTFDGTSPSGTATVPAGVKGELEGGYVTTFFTGAFVPTLPTHGDLGTYDLQCSSAYTCPGAADRPSVFNTSYFSSTTGADLAQWGWIYHAGKHGTWLDQDDNISGDIT